MIPEEEFDFKDPATLRKKAEQELIKKQLKKNPPTEEADIKKLLHELNVHQIELEMQNEELHLAYDTIEATLKKHTMLYDMAPIGFFVLNENSGIMDLNFTGAEMLGEPRFSLLESNFRLFLSQDSLAEFNRFFDELYASDSKESCHIKLGYDQKLERSVYVEGMFADENKQCLLSVVDLSRFSH
jgi:PAS domain-containing protein